MRADGFIESVDGTEEDAMEKAFKYADILRKRFQMDALSVKVEKAGWNTFYLYVVKA
jgi:hypothetical protein